MIQRSLAVVAVSSWVALAASGCGTSCPEIEKARAEFGRRTRTTSGPDARLALPYGLLDRVIAGQLARRAPVPIALPTDKIGLKLSLALALERVTTHAASPGRLGMTLHLDMIDQRSGAAVVELEVDTSVAPRFVGGKAPELSIVLRPQDLGRVKPRPTAEGTRMLAGWLRDALPSFARELVNDAVVQAVAQASLDFVADAVWPHARDALLGSEPLVDARFELPDLSIAEVSMTSSKAALMAQITTDLPDAEPLPPGAEVSGERLVLRLSGGTAMGLIDRAMDRGEVPARFDDQGRPKTDGAWEARVGWRGGPSPLVVHLWKTHDGCKAAEVAARLGLKLEGDTVRVEVRDGRVVSVAGPAFAEAFAWIEELFGKALSATFDTPALVRFAAGAQVVQLRLARVALGEDDLTLDLDLGVAPR